MSGREIRYVLTPQDRDDLRQMLAEFRQRSQGPARAEPDPVRADKPQLCYADADIPDGTRGELTPTRATYSADADQRVDLEPSGIERKLKAFNVTGQTITEGTLCERTFMAVRGYAFPRVRPAAGGGNTQWVWGSADADISFGETGEITVAGGFEDVGSKQTVHYLAIDGQTIEETINILAVYTKLTKDPATFGYLIVDAGCDQPEPLRWGGIIAEEAPARG